jgi:hypothetical protein
VESAVPAKQGYGNRSSREERFDDEMAHRASVRDNGEVLAVVGSGPESSLHVHERKKKARRKQFGATGKMSCGASSH